MNEYRFTLRGATYEFKRNEFVIETRKRLDFNLEKIKSIQFGDIEAEAEFIAEDTRAGKYTFNLTWNPLYEKDLARGYLGFHDKGTSNKVVTLVYAETLRISSNNKLITRIVSNNTSLIFGGGGKLRPLIPYIPTLKAVV